MQAHKCIFPVGFEGSSPRTRQLAIVTVEPTSLPYDIQVIEGVKHYCCWLCHPNGKKSKTRGGYFAVPRSGNPLHPLVNHRSAKHPLEEGVLPLQLMNSEGQAASQSGGTVKGTGKRARTEAGEFCIVQF